MSTLGFFYVLVWQMLIYYITKEIEPNECSSEFKLTYYREFTHYYLFDFPDRVRSFQGYS